MTNLQKEKVQATIPIYCRAKSISANDLAVKVGVSAATISNMKNGNWDNIDDRLWKKVWNMISPDALNGLYQTSDCTSIFNACDNALKNRRMIGITGDTGMGKSTGCKAYAVRPNVYYSYIDATISPKIFLQQLLKDMGKSSYGSLNEMLTRIADELNTQSDPLLIIDECGKLNQAMILCLHSLRDRTITNCGIVLAGMPDFKNGLINHISKGTVGYSEFFRRINLWQELTGLSATEIAYILNSNGITSKDDQREFRKLNRFGDLMNAIELHKTVNV